MLKKFNIADFDLSEKGEIFDSFAICSGNTRVERILSRADASPKDFWYDQDEDELVILLSGNAVLEFEDGLLELFQNDSVLIRKHVKHRVAKTSNPALWLAIFSPLCNLKV